MSVDPLPALGPYRVVRKIAEGGMGAVYQVQHSETGVSYALKTLRPGIASIDDMLEELERFRREAEALGQLSHRHVARIHAAVLEGPQPYLVQDLLTGGSLHERLRAGPFPPEQALATAAKLARGLEHAHAHGILHRDLKPQNVMFDEQGEPVLVDFGLALWVGDGDRLTKTGTVMGTPSFMPPEQARGDRAAIDARSDVYGLGALLYAMLTGRPPFAGGPLLALLNAVLEQEPTPPAELAPGVSAAAEAICLRALAKAPGDRYPSATAFAEALESPDEGRIARRRPVGIAVLVVALCGVLLGVGLRSANSVRPATSASDSDLQPTDPHDAATQAAFLAQLARALDEGPASEWPRAEAQLLAAIGAERLEAELAQAFARLLRRPGDLIPHAERLAASAKRLGLDAEQVRVAKRAAWAAERGWLEGAVAGEVTSKSGAASEYRRLSAVLVADPEVREGVAVVCSRAFTALTRAEGSDRDRVDAARIESAVELQVARNRFLLHAPFRLRRLLEQRDEWLQLLRAGVGLSRSYGLRRLKGHTDARKAARTFDPNSQVGAYVRLLDLNFKVETWGITPPQRIEAIRRLQSLLALTEKDLGPRYIAEVELILSCHQGGRTKLTPLWSEIAARARRARWILQHTPGDPLLIIACRQEVDMWAKANRLDLAEKVWEEAEAALQAFCEGPRRKELARIDLPVRARGMIAIERAVLFREYLKDRRRARAEGLQGLKQARAVYQECKDLGLHGADVERRRFELQAVHGIMGDLEALGRSEEAVALGSQYDERKSCALHRDFMRRMVEHHLERGALKKAKDRVGWLEHDYPKPEHRSDWRRLRARLEAAQAKQTDGPR